MTFSGTTFPWLTVLAVLPLLGALACVVINGKAARLVGIGVSLITLALSLIIALNFQVGGGMQLTEQHVWIKAFGAYYALGLDGIGLTLVLLTAVITPVVLIAGWKDVGADDPAHGHKWTSRAFVGLVLLVESFSMFVFLATDVFLFYIFFEATLIPIYFLIGGFGGPRRSYAAMKFLLYSLLGGLVMLAAIIGLYVVSAQAGQPSYLLSDMMHLQIGQGTARWLFIGFMIAFAIKAPMFPFHTWLPDAAQEGPVGGTVLLVCILDKIGTFGMIRFCLGLFPEASRWATPVVLILAVISILYGAIMAVGSKDLMRLVAFTSVSHFGVMVMAIFAFTSQALVGSTFYMINHGFSTAILFLVVGFMVKRRGSQQVSDFRGVEKVAPVLAGLLLFAAMSTLSLPGMGPFVAEFMSLAGTFSRYPVFAVIGTLVIVLSALYILLMYQRTMTGLPTDAVTETVTTDLTGREKLALAPLVLLILFFGLVPKPMLSVIEPAIQANMQHVGVSDPPPTITAKGGK